MTSKITSSLAKFALILTVFLFCLNISFNSNTRESNLVSWAKADGPSVVTQTFSGRDSTGALVQGGNWVRDLYNFSKSFVNIIALIILLFVAFATILRIQVDTYGIKKLLPVTIIAIVVANISLPIFSISSSVIDTIQDEISFFTSYQWVNAFAFFFRNLTTVTHIGTLGVGMTVASILTGGISGGVTVILALILLIIPVLIIIALGFILSFRPYVLFLAGGLAPIAIMMSVLPQTQAIFKKWLGISVAWLIMPIIVFGIIHLADMIPTISYIPGAGGVVSGIVGFFLPIAIKAGLLLLAIRFPFMIEKDITNLTKIIGKAAWGSALYSGARAGNWLYKTQKGIEENIQNRVNEETEGFDGKSDASKKRYVKMRTDAGANEEAANEEWNNSDVNNRILSFQENARQRVMAERPGGNSWWNNPRVILTGAALASMPLQIIEGIKSKKELANKEVSKQAQKAMGRGFLEVPSGARGIRAGAMRFFFDPRNIRGLLGNLKYIEEIAENDMKGNLSPDQIASHVQTQVLVERMITAMMKAEGIGEDEAKKRLEGRMNRLYVKRESVGTWRDMDFVNDAKLSDVEVPKLMVGYERIQEQALRQSAYGQGQLRREMGGRTAEEAMGTAVGTREEFYAGLSERFDSEEIKRAEGRRRTPGETDAEGASGLDHPGNGLATAERELAEVTGSDTEVSQKLDTLIERISDQTRTLGQGLNINAIRSAVSLVDAAGIRPDDIGSIDGKIAGLVATFSDRMRNMRFREQDIRKFASILESEGTFDISGLSQQLGPAGNDPQIKEILENVQSSKIARVGLSSNSEQAQSVQRISAEIIPKIAQNQNLVNELKKACSQVVEFQLGINPQISPQELNVATNLIANNIGGFAQITHGGENGYDVSAETALRILKAIESSIKEG